MGFYTADISDEHHEKVQVLSPEYHSYGGIEKCRGPIATIRLYDENSDLIKMLKEPGKGRIAVVDVNRAHYAVVGENLMKFAHENNWAGILINGYVRDTAITKTIPVGLWALGTCPRKSHDKQAGERDVEFTFGGVHFKNGEHLLADHDGIIVIDEESLEN
ncbi:MAG: S-adenosylmethionine: 2-demethylmenaquinone methyltransferase [Epsilonproteobacteria bacterium (ex Lamellibrachia satsuma)]|nr:MAG: S-adenosylmethionine: 2-demethylmenaquinone methyltransferase [Epsilonproteobacteria bacterium (ex Lamellibrachia satsuma)]